VQAIDLVSKWVSIESLFQELSADMRMAINDFVTVLLQAVEAAGVEDITYAPYCRAEPGILLLQACALSVSDRPPCRCRLLAAEHQRAEV
jgi:hypothetical protein